MKPATMRWLTPCLLGLPLLDSGASAQPPHPYEDDRPDIVIEATGSRPLGRATGVDSARADRSGGISTTPDHQILVELVPEDTTAGNLFDLNGRTLTFTPDGHGGYSRSVRSVTWEEDIGRAVADGEEIRLPSFMVDFAGRRWGSFFVSRHGLITFGEPFTYSHRDSSQYWWASMATIARAVVTAPTISPLYKPKLGGWSDRYGATQHVAHRPDRVVVTWITSDPSAYVHGAPPERPVRFQLVLGADGSVRFNYADVALGDGMVGLFPNHEITRGDLITGIADPTNPELPGHLDLVDLAIYESTATGVIFEITTRGDHRAGQFYRFHFDVDEPYWSTDEDRDFSWGIDVDAGGDPGIWSRGPTTPKLLAIDGRRLTLLVDVGEGLSASVIAGVGPIDGRWRLSDTTTATPLHLAARPQTDLSLPERRASVQQSEVFHYRSPPDVESIVCRVIDDLGDEFDQFVFHSEFRVDSQAPDASDWTGRDDVKGIGVEHRNRTSPCGSKRLKGHWRRSVWVGSAAVLNLASTRWEERYDYGLALFAHEFTHSWTAHLSYLRDGEREPLFDRRDRCRCHWRWDLHTPAAFPWREDEPGPRSLMGGNYWRDNGDGTFTPLDGYYGGGHSWLDLYAMGLAEATEVPDTFILRNLQAVNEGDSWGPHTGDKEIVSIEQVVAAEGPRDPSARDAQQDFNAAFVYLLEPGRTPDPDMLRLHAEYRDKAIEHWSHVTGGRSRMTTTVPSVANRSPVAVGALADQRVPVDGTAAVDLRGAFRDPDGDPLTYEATSSAPAVASVEVSGSTVTVRAVAVGAATVTVTATDIGGSNTTATLAFRVTVGRAPLTTFTDDPILPGVTPVKAVHFTELRERIDLLRDGAGLAAYGWTDPVLTAGVTPVRLVHLLELRSALAAVYGAAEQAAPSWTDASPTAGATRIRAAHLMELRSAVTALE